MKLIAAAFATLLATTTAQAADVAAYRNINENDIITYVILTDEPATNTGCDKGPYVKLAKVSLGKVPNDIAEFQPGCWISDGDSKLIVYSPPRGDFSGGIANFYTTDFEKTRAFKTWYWEEDGSVPVNLTR
jgi:hypothetical protein